MPYPVPANSRPGNSQFLTAQIALVPGPAIPISPARINRLAIILRNIDPAGAGGPLIWVGQDAGVTPATGFPLQSGLIAGVFGDALTVETIAPIFAIVLAPTTLAVVEITATT